MLEQLVARDARLQDIAATLPTGKLRVLPGRLTDGAAVREGLDTASPGIDVNRYFCDNPLVDDGTDQTSVLNNQWGRNTEETLAALAGSFAETKVTFERENDGHV
jgi:hypothetical protein